jgi:hypothetical protein
MFTLLRHAGLRRSLWAEAPCLGVSMVIAEMFYKFHSFTLECLAFLATWCVLSCLVFSTSRLLSPQPATS